MKYEKLKLYRDNYMDLCMAHQRKITQSDSYCLQDGKSAGRWYSNQLYKIYEWRKEEKQLTEKQMECLMLIAELDNFLYDHFDKLKIYENLNFQIFIFNSLFCSVVKEYTLALYMLS